MIHEIDQPSQIGRVALLVKRKGHRRPDGLDLVLVDRLHEARDHLVVSGARESFGGGAAHERIFVGEVRLEHRHARGMRDSRERVERREAPSPCRSS